MIDEERFEKALKEARKVYDLVNLINASKLPESNPMRMEARDFYLKWKKDIPNWMDTKVFRAAVRYGSNICFYTGLPCTLLDIPAPAKAIYATIEHLHPRSNGGENSKENTVIAMAWINNLLSSAPLAVKLHVREEMQKITFFPNTSMDDKISLLRKTAISVMREYNIDGIDYHPWQWITFDETGRRRHSEILKRLKGREELILRLFGDESAGTHTLLPTPKRNPDLKVVEENNTPSNTTSFQP